ncbi:hypothetical protein WN73_14290, partial [Bradyrhizobium sp. CCBAU 45394]|nr:hypothetical protein [Bradyrhizobium sp. CCBAU 45394]
AATGKQTPNQVLGGLFTDNCIVVKLSSFGQIDPDVWRTIQECCAIWNKDVVKDPEAMSPHRSDNYEGELNLVLIFKAVSANNSKKLQFKLPEGDQ